MLELVTNEEASKKQQVYISLKEDPRKDEELQVVYGEVYAPNRVDTDKETITSYDVRKMAHDFLSTGKIENIDIQHDLVKSGCTVVESFIARPNDPDFTEGSWVLGVKCTDEVWALVKSGNLNGYSFYGTSKKYPATVLVEVAKQIAGITELSTAEIIPEHSHTFIVNMDNDGQIVSGKTDKVLGHSHILKYGTATEEALDHSHRVVLG